MLNFNFYLNLPPEFLDGINSRLDQIMTTQAEAVIQLTALSVTLDKISGETSSLVKEVTDLQAAAANAGNISPELQAAIDAVTTRAASIDALVPDAPVVTPPVDSGVVPG